MATLYGDFERIRKMAEAWTKQFAAIARQLEQLANPPALRRMAEYQLRPLAVEHPRAAARQHRLGQGPGMVEERLVALVGSVADAPSSATPRMMRPSAPSPSR